MIARQLSPSVVQRLKREAARRSFLKWWVPVEPQGFASLATIKPGRRARRPIIRL